MDPDDRVTRLFSADDRATAMGPTAAPPSPAPTSRPAWAVGNKVLQGQFELLQALRGGAQALAFRARALDGSEVFVKIQPNPWQRDDTFAKQIELRPRLLAIRHPNLLRCLACDIDHGDLVEVCEFVRGEELSAVLERGPLSETMVRQLAQDLSAGVHALHESGLVHRDLKPSNVMLLQHEGRPCLRIIDYGIVSRIDAGGLTRVAGTVQYSPPERMQRYIENNELARAWDWWSVGSLLQEAIDGRHPYQRLRELFPAETGARGDHHALEHVFDEIQREGAMERYRMHAGMVEITARNPAAAPWLPLLRGLLTFNRDRRWGWLQVQGFLTGAAVPEYYDERRQREDDTGYEDDEGQRWRTLADHAVHLAQTAAQGPVAAANPGWQRARRAVFKGDILRHARDTLHDAELTLRLNACIWIHPGNRDGPHWHADLATALALFVVAEGAIPQPNICGLALDDQGLRYFAAQLDGHHDVEAEDRLRGLLSAPFQQLLRRVAPAPASAAAAACADSLAAVQEQVDALRRSAHQLGVNLPEAYLRERPSLLVRLVTTTVADDARCVGQEYRQRLGGTSNAALQRLFSTPELETLDPLSLKTLRLSLMFLQDNGYETLETTAERMQEAARRLRSADALVRGARRLRQPRLWWPMTGLALLAFILISSGLVHGLARQASPGWTLGDLWQAFFGPGGPEPRLVRRVSAGVAWSAMAGAAAIYGLLTTLLLRGLRPAVVADLNELGHKLSTGAYGRKAAETLAANLVGPPPTDEAGASYRQRLDRLNARLRSLPTIATARYVQPPARLPRSGAVLVAAAAALLLPWGAAAWLVWQPPDALQSAAPAAPAPADLRRAAATTSPAQADYRYPALVTTTTDLRAGVTGTCRVAAGTEVQVARVPAAPQVSATWLPPQVCPQILNRIQFLAVRAAPARGPASAPAGKARPGAPDPEVAARCIEQLSTKQFESSEASSAFLGRCIRNGGAPTR